MNAGRRTLAPPPAPDESPPDGADVADLLAGRRRDPGRRRYRDGRATLGRDGTMGALLRSTFAARCGAPRPAGAACCAVGRPAPAALGGECPHEGDGEAPAGRREGGTTEEGGK